MKPKTSPYKFTKKHKEPKGQALKSKKNYENIFNDILSGVKSDNSKKGKNKIKLISKIETTNSNNVSNLITKTINLTEESEKNDEKYNKKINKIINNHEKYINIVNGPENIKNAKTINFIDDCMIMNRHKENKDKLKIEKNKKNKTENNTENELILLINDKKKRFIKLPHENNKNNYIKSVRTIKKSNDLKHKELNNDRSLSKNHFFKDSDGKNKMNKKFIRNRQIKTKGKKMEIKKKTNNIIYNNKKMFEYNTFDKITITNKSNSKSKYKDYISIKNNCKKKRLILNDTNSNINININITNINEKKSKKENSLSSERKQSKKNERSNYNNYNSNITTVNIINNNNSKKISSRLLFYNNSNKKYLPYPTKVSSKGIKIESIDINLSEENTSPQKPKFKFTKNMKKKNIKKSYTNNKENNYKNEVLSEYEHFRDYDDFWSNKSSTSYSCKSGFTATRKLRSLSRERDKIKMMNNLKNYEKNKIDKIEDKLINIVNKFHKENSINSKKNSKT